MLPLKRTLPKLTAFFILTLSGFTASGPLAGISWAQGPRPAAIRFSPVKAHTIRQSVDLPGSVVARRSSTVATQISGLVVDYPVRAGQQVEQGQIVAQLRDQRLRLDLRAAEAQLGEDETRLQQAEQNLERAQELFERNVFSRQQLDDAQFERRALSKRIERLKASIARLQDDIDRSAVRAPFAGIVVRELTQIGEWLPEGGGVVELLAANELEIEVPVPEQYFSRLNRRATATVRFEALPSLELPARIVSVVPVADPQARTFPIRLEPLRRERRLGVGMAAEAHLTLGGTRRALLIPKDAIVRQGGREVVYLLNSDQTVKLVTVKSGAGVGQWVEVDGPLSADDLVVTRGNERLQPGQDVIAEPLEYAFP